MTQRQIPFLLVRGGTSRGPYFRASDLPSDRELLADVLLAVVCGGHPTSIDGIGGGNPVTTKVAMLSRSEDPDADVDYFFAQVSVAEPMVDFTPTCGNILVGVGPAAIEMGLVAPQPEVTMVRIRAVNTGALVNAEVETPGGRVNYAGGTSIDGVPGTAAPVGLEFLRITGSRTGSMFPTGSRREMIEGFEVTCMDVAMPMMIGRAADFGLSGDESRDQLDADAELFERMESVRLTAGQRMGLGDVTRSVVPKIGLISEPREGGSFAARYFMPWSTHPSMAVTGSQCLAACALAPGTVGEGIASGLGASPSEIAIEHLQGKMHLTARHRQDGDAFEFASAAIVRTARLIARGHLMVPDHVWPARDSFGR